MILGYLETKNYRNFRIVDRDTRAALVEFEGAALVGGALPGDFVHWDGGAVRYIQCAANGSDSLFLVGTLELAAKVRYGMTSRGSPLYRFTPFSEAYPPFFVGCSQRDTTRNILCRIEYSKWDAKSSCPQGTLVQTYGSAGDLAAEEVALLEHYGPTRWKRGELTTDLHIPRGTMPYIPPEEGVETFHIDPPGCRDIDDAVTLVRLAGHNNYRVRIHIADVASWLQVNPGLKRKAEACGQTLYRDGVAVRPMFPVELSEGLFSLLPGQRRLVLTVEVDWVAGRLSEPRWSQEIIQVTHSYTYESAKGATWAGTLAAITATMKSGSGGGALEPLTDPHEWVEQLMLFYNRAAAAELRSLGEGVLRRHAAPDMARMEALKALGLPAERMAMRAGEYCLGSAADVAHWGLGAAVYCHATSPIRRWADCLNQMALLQIIRETVIKEEDRELWCVTAGAVANLERAGRAAKGYERDLLFLRALVGPGAVTRRLRAVVVESGRIWIEAWGRLQKADTQGEAPGTVCSAHVFCDAGQRNWKRRLVVKLDFAGGPAAAAPAPAAAPQI